MITSFHGVHRFLSNFYQSVVDLDGDLYLTVEHAYQAAKTEDMERRRQIRNAGSPSEAKRLGRKCEVRPDWGSERLEVMEHLLRQKFARGGLLARRLLDTDDEEIVEGNTWGDTFWGVCDGQGQNHLGRLLMQIRNELREAQLS